MKINFDKLNLGKKVRNLVVGTALVMSPLAGDAQETVLKDLPLNYDTTENPITKETIDMLEADSLQEDYPIYISRIQAEWEPVNKDIYMDGYRDARKETFNPEKIKVSKDKTFTQFLYYLYGIQKGWDSLSEKEQEKREKNAENVELARKGKNGNGDRKRFIAMREIARRRTAACGASKQYYGKGKW